MKRWERYAEVVWPVGHIPEREIVPMSRHRWHWVANLGPKFFMFKGAAVFCKVRAINEAAGGQS